MTDDEHQAAHKLAAHTGFDYRTALRWLRRETMKRGSEMALTRAAEELKIKRPEPQREAS
jgi:hypothetical protein